MEVLCLVVSSIVCLLLAMWYSFICAEYYTGMILALTALLASSTSLWLVEKRERKRYDIRSGYNWRV